MNPSILALWLVLNTLVCHSYSETTNLPEKITSDGSRFNEVYFDFSKSGFEFVDSIVLNIDSINNLDWKGSTELQIIIGNKYPDFYYGSFEKISNRYKVDKLIYSDGFDFKNITSDSLSKFNFKFMRLGYDFQKATPYFHPGIWGKFEIYFGNGKSYKSEIIEERELFTAGMRVLSKKIKHLKAKTSFDANGRTSLPTKMATLGFETGLK